jgi:hypothetical protein
MLISLPINRDPWDSVEVNFYIPFDNNIQNYPQGSGGFSSKRFADHHPLWNFIFSFFLKKNEKIPVILPRRGFENRFFTLVATPSDKPPSPHWFSGFATDLGQYTSILYSCYISPYLQRQMSNITLSHLKSVHIFRTNERSTAHDDISNCLQYLTFFNTACDEHRIKVLQHGLLLVVVLWYQSSWLSTSGLALSSPFYFQLNPFLIISI